MFQCSVLSKVCFNFKCPAVNCALPRTPLLMKQAKLPFEVGFRRGGGVGEEGGAIMIPNQRKQKLFIRSYLGFILTVRHFYEV